MLFSDEAVDIATNSPRGSTFMAKSRKRSLSAVFDLPIRIRGGGVGDGDGNGGIGNVGLSSDDESEEKASHVKGVKKATRRSAVVKGLMRKSVSEVTMNKYNSQNAVLADFLFTATEEQEEAGDFKKEDIIKAWFMEGLQQESNEEKRK